MDLKSLFLLAQHERPLEYKRLCVYVCARYARSFVVCPRFSHADFCASWNGMGDTGTHTYTGTDTHARAHTQAQTHADTHSSW